MRNDMAKMLVAGLLLPAVLMAAAMGYFNQPESAEGSVASTAAPRPTSQPTAAQTTLPSTLPAVTTRPTVPAAPEIQIQVVMEEEVKEMDLEAYLLGVMLAEVPAKFQFEALKAQAVASRTYTLLRCKGKKSHTLGAVCTDSSCCQAYISPEAYILRGGKWADLEKMRKALEETKGQVLTYNDKLIVATYFSCSGGSTEAAQAVWGGDYPYLQAVESPGEEIASFFEDEKIFTEEEIMQVLNIRLEGKPETWFGAVEYTQGGGVKTMHIGGVPYKGTTLRTLLGLRSTAFTVSFHDGFVFFKTKGYGHRVGMSQYGAEAMAREGSGYEQILYHYYTGTSIRQYEP